MGPPADRDQELPRGEENQKKTGGSTRRERKQGLSRQEIESKEFQERKMVPKWREEARFLSRIKSGVLKGKRARVFKRERNYIFMKRASNPRKMKPGFHLSQIIKMDGGKHLFSWYVCLSVCLSYAI